MPKTRFVLLLCALLLAGVAQAATIPVPSGGFGWVSIDPFDRNGNGTPYFDYASGDGSPPGNVWQVLNALVGIPDARLEFWGAPGGTADPSILFDLTTGSESVPFTLKFEFAANAGVNEFGWVAGDLGGDGYQGSDLHPIFAGSATSGASTVVALPTGPYGLYLKNTVTGEVFLSLAGSSPTDPGQQHFSVFRDTLYPGTLWIGVEDLKLGLGDRDYNDLVVTASAHTPEPATLLLLGTGLAAAAGVAGRRRRGSSPV